MRFSARLRPRLIVSLPLGVAASLIERIAPGRASAILAGPNVIEPGPATPAATPSGKQALTIAGTTSDIASLDPALVRDSDLSFLARQLFSGLVRFNDRLEPVLDLAGRAEISSDGLTYAFELAATAAFQDGAPITAADVAFSLTRAVSPSTAGGDLTALGGPTFLSGIKGYGDVAGGGKNSLAGVTIGGPRSIAIELVQPDSTFLMKLASTPALIVDRRDIERGSDWWRSPNASGPFGLSEFIAQDHLTFVSNQRYISGPPPLQTITVLLGPNAVSPFNLYQSGKVDIADVGLESVDRVLAPDAGYLNQLRATPLFSVDMFVFDPEQPPMDDPFVRRALAQAFPRAKVAEVTLNGHATAAAGVIPNGMLGQNWPAETPPFDPDAARAAIAKSRYGAVANVPPIQLFVSGGGSAESLRDSVAETVGLKIEVISMEWPDFIAALGAKSLPAYELYWTADFPDPASILSVLFGTGRPDNYANYSNPKMDSLLTQAADTESVDERIALYRSAQQLLIDDAAVMPVLFDIGYTLVNPIVKGLTVTPMGIISLAPLWLEH